LRPQSGELLSGELKHEVWRKSPAVAANLLVEALGAYAIKRGELGVENDAMAAQDEDGAGDDLGRRLGFGSRHGNLSEAAVVIRSRVGFA